MAMLRRVGLSAEPLLRNGGLSTRLSSIRLCTSGTVPADSGAVSASGPQPLQRLPNGQWPELPIKYRIRDFLKDEYAPPGPRSFVGSLRELTVTVNSRDWWYNQTMGSLFLYACLVFEVFCFYQIGKGIGKRQLRGYHITGASGNSGFYKIPQHLIDEIGEEKLYQSYKAMGDEQVKDNDPGFTRFKESILQAKFH